MQFNDAVRGGVISAGMDFDTVETVCRLFGRTCRRLPFHRAFRVPDKPDTIAWLAAEKGGRGWSNVPEHGLERDEHGFNEIVAIREFNKDSALTDKRIDDEIARPQTRHVFYREARLGELWYKFYGTFKIDIEATEASRTSEQPCVVYRRTSKTAECFKSPAKVQVISDADFAAYKGQLVRMNLLDEIRFTADCTKPVVGEVRAWPNMKLVVKDVLGGKAKAVCETLDDDLLTSVQRRLSSDNVKELLGDGGRISNMIVFEIPKRDFELGYAEAVGQGSSEDTKSAVSAGAVEEFKI